MPQRVIQVNQHKPTGGLWDIPDFLALVAEYAATLKWIIIPSEELWITHKGEIECPEGIVLDFLAFSAYASDVFQSIWGIYVGDASLTKLEAFNRTEYLDRQAEELDIALAFEAIDSSFWLVTARDESVLRQIEIGCGELVR